LQGKSGQKILPVREFISVDFDADPEPPRY